jgi:hypothetical protein
LPALHIQTTAAAAADITSMKATHKRTQHRKILTGSSKISTSSPSQRQTSVDALRRFRPTITRPISTVCASAFIPSVLVGPHRSGPSPRYQVFVPGKEKKKKKQKKQEAAATRNIRIWTMPIPVPRGVATIQTKMPNNQ